MKFFVMVRQDLPQYDGIHLRGRQDFMDFFAFLPSLMEGRKPNPAQGREIAFPPRKGITLFAFHQERQKISC
jgi:hypothetical protein